MLDPTRALTAPEVGRPAQDLLEEQLPVNAEGEKCPTADLCKGLGGVAATKGTLEAGCADLVGTPNPHPMRGYVNEQLCVEELPEVEQQWKAAWAAEGPRRVRHHAQEVASDYPERPDSGTGEQDRERWGRGKAQDGTPRGSRVATADWVLHGWRVTRARRLVRPGADPGSVLDPWLTRVTTPAR